MSVLRVIDEGRVGALRSQSLWHGIASAMGDDGPTTLSLCRPAESYVSIGYHRRLAELDLDACRSEALPVLRRRIGGGPVLIEPDQLFFQVTIPVRGAPAGVERLYATALAPAVEAFRALGADARIDGMNDIVVGAGKVSGTGAGQIGDAVVVVGNVMFAFDHARMARVLALPDDRMRDECLRLMRGHVSSLADLGLGSVTPEQATVALRDAYAEQYGAAIDASLSEAEESAVQRWGLRMSRPEWRTGPAQPEPLARRVKIRAGVFVVHGESDGVHVLATVVGDAIERAWIDARHLNGTAPAIAGAVTGDLTPDALAERMAPFGPDGDRVLTALLPGLEARC